MNGLQELKQEYQKALDQNQESFIFQGEEVLTSYAKYLIEYMESYFEKGPSYGSYEDLLSYKQGRSKN